jgi:sec-independent protein translocase protein TatA
MFTFHSISCQPLAFWNSPTALILLILVFLLLFGGKNIPELMKGLGQGVRELKKGMQQEEEPNPDRFAGEEREARIRAEIEAEVDRRVETERRSKRES